MQKIAKNVQNILAEVELANLLISIRSVLIYSDSLNEQSFDANAKIWDRFSEVIGMELNTEQRNQIAMLLGSLREVKEAVETVRNHHLETIEDVGISIRGYRSQFYDLILKTTELTSLLTDYHLDKEKEEEYRSTLYFDAHLGGD